MKNLSSRQLELLRYLEKSVQEEQRMPSYREMAKEMNVSAVGTIQDHVQALIREGYLEKDGKKLRLAGARQSPVLNVPIVGEVAAGALQDAFEVALGALPLSPDILKNSKSPRDYFALKVHGDSMVDAGIHAGDYVVVDKRGRYKNGDIVVAQYQNEATLKEIRLPKDKKSLVQLIPHNARMSPIKVKADEDFKVLGKVVSIQRYF